VAYRRMLVYKGKRGKIRCVCGSVYGVCIVCVLGCVCGSVCVVYVCVCLGILVFPMTAFFYMPHLSPLLSSLSPLSFLPPCSLPLFLVCYFKSLSLILCPLSIWGKQISFVLRTWPWGSWADTGAFSPQP